MKTPQQPRDWLRGTALPILLLAVLSVGWGAVVNLAMYRSLGVRTFHLDNTPVTLMEELAGRIPGGAEFYMLGVPTIILVVCARKRRLRWWVIPASVVIFGSPIAILGGRIYARYLWQLNRGGEPLEEVVPVTVAFVAACFLGLIADMLLDRRQRHVAAERAAHGLCPKCSFDLRGTAAAGLRRCPECGRSFEVARGDAELPTGQISDRAGVFMIPPSTDDTVVKPPEGG